MSARDLFGLIVRGVGLTFVMFALFDLFHVGLALSGHEGMNQHSVGVLVAAVASYVAAGLAMLAGARRVVRLCYGPIGSPGD